MQIENVGSFSLFGGVGVNFRSDGFPTHVPVAVSKWIAFPNLYCLSSTRGENLHLIYPSLFQRRPHHCRHHCPPHCPAEAEPPERWPEASTLGRSSTGATLVTAGVVGGSPEGLGSCPGPPTHSWRVAGVGGACLGPGQCDPPSAKAPPGC